MIILPTVHSYTSPLMTVASPLMMQLSSVPQHLSLTLNVLRAPGNKLWLLRVETDLVIDPLFFSLWFLASLLQSLNCVYLYNFLKKLFETRPLIWGQLVEKCNHNWLFWKFILNTEHFVIQVRSCVKNPHYVGPGSNYLDVPFRRLPQQLRCPRFIYPT